MFNIFKTTKNNVTTSFTRWFGIADAEDGVTINIDNVYNTNAYVNIAVDKITQNIIRANPEITDSKDNVVKSGPLYNLFRDVNPRMSTAQLFEATTAYILLRGECIWIISSNSIGGIPFQIDVVDPLYFKHYLNEQGTEIILWQYERDGKKVPFMPSEIIHFCKWNPQNAFRGVNPLIALSVELENDRLINRNNTSLLKNKSVPAGLLTTDETITQEQAKEILEMWEKNHGSSSKVGRTGVLGSGTKYQQLGLSSAEAEYFKSKAWNRSVILGKYGVPAIVAGYKDESTPLSGSDTSEQLKFFWQQTLLPMLRFIQDKLDTEFFRRFAPNYKIRFDTSNIEELQDDMTKINERIRANVASGIMTQNEGRDILGYEPVVWGDTWWKSNTVSDVKSPQVQAASTKNSLFDKDYYSVIEKQEHLYKVKNHYEQGVKDLDIVLHSWLWEQRSLVLKDINNNGEINSKFWEQQVTLLKSSTDKVINNIRLITISDIDELMVKNKIDERYKNYVMNVANEIDNVVIRLSDYVYEFIINSIMDRDVDSIKDKYNIVKSKIGEISKIEVGRLINQIRLKTFLSVGIEKHMWYGPDNNNVIKTDGEIVKIGEMFKNNNIHPMDNNKDFAITMPIKGDII